MYEERKKRGDKVFRKKASLGYGKISRDNAKPSKLRGANLSDNENPIIVLSVKGRNTNDKYENINYENLLLFVDPVVMVEILEENSVALNSVALNFESENKAADLDSFKMSQMSPEILEVINASFIGGGNLSHLLFDSNEQSGVFFSEDPQDLLQIFRSLGYECHNSSSHLLNSERVMDLECGPFSIFFNFLTYSSLNSSSSTGYQSILSQNSWSSSDNVPVLMNLSNMSFFINLTTALAKNLESNFNSFLVINSAILPQQREGENEYLKVSDLNNIYFAPMNFLETSELILSASFLASSVDNLNFAEKFSSISNLTIFSRNACLATSLQFNSECLSILDFNSLGKDKVIFTILPTPISENMCKYVEDVQVSKSFDSRRGGA